MIAKVAIIDTNMSLLLDYSHIINIGFIANYTSEQQSLFICYWVIFSTPGLLYDENGHRQST